MISAKRKEKKRKDKPEIYRYLLPPMSKDCQDISLLLSDSLTLLLSPCYQKTSRRKRIKDTLSLHYQKVRRPTIEKY